MGFFDEDDFDSIVREFLGDSRGNVTRRRVSANENEERVIDFIESEGKIYLIFEMPGFSEQEVFVNIKNRIIEISAQKRELENVKEYLAQKLRAGLSYRRTLPEFVDTKKYDFTFKNGVLEVVFNRRKE